MDAGAVVSLVKERLGIRTSVRDVYLTAIVDGVLREISDELGLTLDATNPYHLMFVVDFAAWRYQSRDSADGVPKHLQFRLQTLMLHVSAGNPRVDEVVTVDELPAVPDDYTVYILTTDGSAQVYVDSAWVTVEYVNGAWVVATT